MSKISFIILLVSLQIKIFAAFQVATFWEENLAQKADFKIEETSSGNYGVQAFQITDKNELCLLLNSQKEIRIIDPKTKALKNSINLSDYPERFCADKNFFYVLSRYRIYAYSRDKEVEVSYPVSRKFRFIKELKIIEDNLYLLTAAGFTCTLKENGQFLTPGEQEKSARKGYIQNDLCYYQSIKYSSHTATIMVYDNQEELLHSKNLSFNQKLGSAEIIKAENEKIYLNLEFITREKPLKVTRKVAVYSVTEAKLIETATLPENYYFKLQSDLMIKNGKLYLFSSLPNTCAVFALKKDRNIAKTIFPEPHSGTVYRYNNLVLQEAENLAFETFSRKPLKGLTRDEIMANADRYEKLSWMCTEVNTTNHEIVSIGSAEVRTPQWVTVGEKIKMPYKWGGFTHVDVFNDFIADGKLAGDDYTASASLGDGYCIGVDCSGFVSRVWDIPNKQSTRSLPRFSTELPDWSCVQRGDIANIWGTHVMLIDSYNPSGTLNIIHASGGSWDVNYDTISLTQLNDAIPRKFNSLVEDVIVEQEITDHQLGDETLTLNLDDYFTSLSNQELTYTVDNLDNPDLLNIQITGSLLTVAINSNQKTEFCTVRLKASTATESNFLKFKVFNLPAEKPLAGFGGSYSFTGSDYAEIPLENNENLNSLSLSCWIKLNEGGSLQGIAGRTTDQIDGWHIYSTAANKLKFVIATEEGKRTLYSTTSLALDKWYHLAITYDGNSQKIFLDGNLDSSETFETSSPLTEAEANMLIGKVGYYELSAQIDEFSLWYKALSLAEIRELLKKYPTGSESGLAGYWNFNEGYGNLLEDISAHNQQGKLVEVNYGGWNLKGAPVTYFTNKSVTNFQANLLGESGIGRVFTIEDSESDLGSIELLDESSGLFTFVPTGETGIVVFNYYLKIAGVDSESCTGKIIISEPVGIEDDNLRIGTLTLKQNYPNPFNPATKISFTNDLDQQIIIDIYNSNGQLVEKLCDQIFPKGKHLLNFNASHLTSGMYIYKLKAGDKKLHKTMILIK